MHERNYTLWRIPDFAIAQCRDCAIPGYLIVNVVPEATSLARLDSKLVAQLGLVMKQAAVAVEDIIQPLKLYCAQFGEETQQLHFHIFPRTQQLTEAYLSEYPAQRDLIHGPVLLDWARTHYKDKQLSTRSWELIEQIRSSLGKTVVEPA